MKGVSIKYVRMYDALEVPQKVEDPYVDQQKTNQWLRSTGLKGETEGLMIAAQDLSLATRSYHHRTIKDATNPHCRICGKFEESMYHIVSGCPVLAKTEYSYRPNKTAEYIHWKICRGYEIETTETWYEHQPTTATENSEVTIIRDIPVHNDREIKANRSDIVV